MGEVALKLISLVENGKLKGGWLVLLVIGVLLVTKIDLIGLLENRGKEELAAESIRQALPTVGTGDVESSQRIVELSVAYTHIFQLDSEIKELKLELEGDGKMVSTANARLGAIKLKYESLQVQFKHEKLLNELLEERLNTLKIVREKL